jgi:hypothetical protein
MTPEAALIELLDRVAAGQGSAVLISEHELCEWPPIAVTAMRAQGLLTRAGPAGSAVCPGCEDECTRPVNVVPAGAGSAALFVVCDARSDINRVSIAPDRLAQWQSTAGSIAKFVADCLSLRFSGKRQDKEQLLEIGLMSGDLRSQMLCLGMLGGPLLVAGSSHLPLTEAIRFRDGRYAPDAPLVRQLVDTATTGDARYTPSTARREVRKLETAAMHERWRKTYRVLKRKRPNMSDVWYSLQIAKLDIAQGRSAGTIKKNMK